MSNGVRLMITGSTIAAGATASDILSAGEALGDSGATTILGIGCTVLVAGHVCCVRYIAKLVETHRKDMSEVIQANTASHQSLRDAVDANTTVVARAEKTMQGCAAVQDARRIGFGSSDRV